MSDTKSLIPRISIIIPAYNTATFLDRAIRNIAEEQFSDCDSSFWELIIVNDGSTDTTADIAGQWQKRYPRNIHILNQSNQGVSAARNAGIEMAQGEYIYFMDSDDLLRQNTLPDLVDKAKRHGLEMLAFNFRIITPGEYDSMHTKAPEPIQSPEPTTMSAYDYLWITDSMPYPFLFLTVWRAIYSRDFINRNNIRFSTQLICGEDTIFIYNTLFANPKFSVLPAVHLFYNLNRQGNATLNIDHDHLRKFTPNRVQFIQKFYEFIPLIAQNQDIPNHMVTNITQNMKYWYRMLADDALTLDASLWDLIRLRRWCKNYGGKVSPGTPRFIDKTRNYTFRQKCKRWLIAYPITTVLGIFDALHGHGLWIDPGSQTNKTVLTINADSKKLHILKSLKAPSKRKIAIIIDDITDLTPDLNKLISNASSYGTGTDILLWASGIPCGHESNAPKGCTIMDYIDINDHINYSPDKNSWVLTTMSDLQLVDTILLKAKRNIAPEAITPILAKVINLDSDQLSWKQAFEVAGL